MQDQQTIHMPGLVIVSTSTKPKRSVIDWVESCIAAGICLIQDCGRKTFCRGLCSRCYQRYHSSRPINRVKAAQYDHQLIREGVLLEERRGHRSSKVPNPFRDAASASE
jgi:hypothetical protein